MVDPRASALRRVRASAVCVHDASVLCVRLRDPLTRIARLFVPGGMIEPGEAAAAAAAREALEETGYAVVVDPQSELTVVYPYVWSGLEVECETHFFAARLARPAEAPRRVNDAPYWEAVVWLPLAELDQLSFHTAIYRAVRSLTGAGGSGR